MILLSDGFIIAYVLTVEEVHILFIY